MKKFFFLFIELGENDILVNLDMSWCSIRLAGAKELAEAIGENSGLISLNLSNNSFTNDTIELLTNSLARNITLCELDLSDNQFICRYDVAVKANPRILLTGNGSELYKMIVSALTNQSLKILRVRRIKEGTVTNFI